MLWDHISIFVYSLVTYPFIRLFDSGDIRYIAIIFGLFVAICIVKVSRLLPFTHAIFLRPSSAMNCNLINQGGPCGGAIGMPSGHVLVTTYMLVSLLLLDDRISSTKASVSAIIVIVMGVSRYQKHCHNIPQLIVGALIGASLAVVNSRLVRIDKYISMVFNKRIQTA